MREEKGHHGLGRIETKRKSECQWTEGSLEGRFTRHEGLGRYFPDSGQSGTPSVSGVD